MTILNLLGIFIILSVMFGLVSFTKYAIGSWKAVGVIWLISLVLTTIIAFGAYLVTLN